MRGYQYDPSPEWDWFSVANGGREPDVSATQNARKKEPTVTAGEVTVVLIFAMAAALMIDLALTLFRIG